MNAGGTTVSGVSSFTTLTSPTATIGGATLLSTISAQVSGSVDANGSDTSVTFEYGTNGTSFPNSVTATPGTVTGDVDTPVSAVLNNLLQGTTYYYRVKAVSAGGTTDEHGSLLQARYFVWVNSSLAGRTSWRRREAFW